MKKAVLIIAHKNIVQLKRLVSKFDLEDYDIFIHVDKKWKSFNDDRSAIRQDNVHFTSRRYEGALFSWVLVQITLELIHCAIDYSKKKGKKYSYFLLLSGQDYPIKNCKWVSKQLDNLYPKPLIDVTPYDSRNYIAGKYKYYRIYTLNNLLDSRLVNHKWMRRVLRLPIKIIEYFITLIVGSPKKNIKKYKLAGGSQWWILPDQIIDYIIEQEKENSRDFKMFKHIHTPDETFFQSMALSWDKTGIIDLNNPSEREQNCMTYAFFTDDYAGNGKYPFTGHPYIIRNINYDWIITLPHFFARKFDSMIDSIILDRLDQFTGNL